MQETEMHNRRHTDIQPSLNVLKELYDRILSRKTADPEKSYTASLFDRGRPKIAQKLGEEAVETIIASLTQEPEDVVHESADLLYHLLVLWAERGIKPENVWKELAGRFAISGFEEKQSRGRRTTDS